MIRKLPVRPGQCRRLTVCLNGTYLVPWSIRRTLATAANAPTADVDTLPLKGFKVLDMTRVLAGVRGQLKVWRLYTDGCHSHIAHKYLAILGMIHYPIPL